MDRASDSELILDRYNEIIERGDGKLNLSGNYISDISVLSSCDLSNLRELNLGYNKISVLSSCDLSNLRELNLRCNNISDISCLYRCDLSNLRELSLWGNKIVDYREKVDKILSYLYDYLYKVWLSRLLYSTS